MPKISTPFKETEKRKTTENTDSEDWPVSSITGLPRCDQVDNHNSDSYSEISTWDGLYKVLSLDFHTMNTF